MTEDKLREIVNDIFAKEPLPECNIYIVDKRDGKLKKYTETQQFNEDMEKAYLEWKESLNLKQPK